MTAVIERQDGAVASTIRTVQPDDRACLLAMYERCGSASRYHRWHGHTASFPAAYLNAVLSDAGGQFSIVALRDGRIVALASLAEVEAEADAGVGEIAILVEDACQAQGVGRALADRLVAQAQRDGLRQVRAEMFTDDAGLTRLLRRHGPTQTRISYGVLTATLELASAR